MKRSMSNAVFALLTALCGLAVLLGPSLSRAQVTGTPVDTSIVVKIESPKGDVAGVVLVQGFAIAHAGIDRVEWWVDGVHKGKLPHGGSRGDVPGSYPAYPKAHAENSGFSAAWSMALFEPGEHEIVVSAYDENGSVNSASATFTSNRFGDGDERFIRQDEVILQNFVLSDVRLYPGDDTAPQYDIVFAWSQAAQTFVATKITKSCEGCFVRLAKAPSGLKVTFDGQADANVLDWTPNDAAVIGYEVQRRSVADVGQVVDASPWTSVGFQTGYKSFFIDEDLPKLHVAGERIEYRVRAFSEQDISPWTGPASLGSGNGNVVLPGGNGGGNGGGDSKDPVPTLPGFPLPDPGPNFPPNPFPNL